MLRPRPLPSVLRELSPRTKRSVSSSPLMFRRVAEMLRKVTAALSASAVRSRYTRGPRWAYLQMLFSRLSKMRHMCRPSAMIFTDSSGFVRISSSPAAESFSLYSPAIWSSRMPSSHSVRFTLMLPLDALDASSRSSMSFLSFADCRSSTSRYSRIFSFSGCSFSSRST